MRALSRVFPHSHGVGVWTVSTASGEPRGSGVWGLTHSLSGLQLGWCWKRGLELGEEIQTSVALAMGGAVLEKKLAASLDEPTCLHRARCS